MGGDSIRACAKLDDTPEMETSSEEKRGPGNSPGPSPSKKEEPSEFAELPPPVPPRGEAGLVEASSTTGSLANLPEAAREQQNEGVAVQGGREPRNLSGGALPSSNEISSEFAELPPPVPPPPGEKAAGNSEASSTTVSQTVGSAEAASVAAQQQAEVAAEEPDQPRPGQQIVSF